MDGRINNIKFAFLIVHSIIEICILNYIIQNINFSLYYFIIQNIGFYEYNVLF